MLKHSTILIYLLLIAIGFYFGKWLGAIGLAGIYYAFFQHQPFRSAKRLHDKAPECPDHELKEAYAELGVPRSSDMTAIEKARRRLLNHYHPDKWHGASDKEKQCAADKVRQINHAYRVIQQHKQKEHS